MGVSVSPKAREVHAKWKNASALVKYKKGDVFEIPYNTYNESDDIKNAVVALMEESVTVEGCKISWSMKVDKNDAGEKVVVVFLVAA